MHKELYEKIEFEITQIEHLLETHKLLLNLCKIKVPDSTEIAAIGSILHSFYNGIERIFLLIAKDYDNTTPKGDKWHRDLIKLMNSANSERDQIITDETTEIILNYLGFRHFFRHSYDFNIEWDLIKDNFLNIENNWNLIKNDILKFIRK